MYDFKDKKGNTQTLNRLMLAKTIRMFEWQGLPETIPHRQLERMLQVNGYAFIVKIGDTPRVFTGGLGGVPDEFGDPTEIVVANPALNVHETFKLTDGVLVKNDDSMLGLMPLFDKYNFLTVENDINMVLYGYSSRMNRWVSAPDDNTKESAERCIKKAVDGEMAVVGENIMFDGIRVQSDSVQTSAVTQLIEYAQHIKGTLYNELGISANTNLKRERLVTDEVQQNEAGLFTLVYNMMACRIEAVEEINALLGTDLKVGFGSVWADKQREFVDDEVTTDEHLLEDNSDSTGTGSSSTVHSEDGTREPERTPDDETGRDGGESEADSEKRDNIEKSIKEVESLLESDDVPESDRSDWEELLAQYREELKDI